jgi:hypothetical protein
MPEEIPFTPFMFDATATEIMVNLLDVTYQSKSIIDAFKEEDIDVTELEKEYTERMRMLGVIIGEYGNPETIASIRERKAEEEEQRKREEEEQRKREEERGYY